MRRGAGRSNRCDPAILTSCVAISLQKSLAIERRTPHYPRPQFQTLTPFEAMNALSCAVRLVAPLASCFVFGLAQPAHGDVALNAPGVPVGTESANMVPFRNTLTLPNCYRFIFSGTEARGTTTGAPGSSGTQGNGGLVLFKAFVSATESSTPTTGAVQLTFTDIQTYNVSPLKTLTLTPSAAFVSASTPINVQLVWQGRGTVKSQPASLISWANIKRPPDSHRQPHIPRRPVGTQTLKVEPQPRRHSAHHPPISGWLHGAEQIRRSFRRTPLSGRSFEKS